MFEDDDPPKFKMSLLHRKHVESFMSLRASKTLDHMSEEQIAGWGSLGNAIRANIIRAIVYMK